MFTKCLSHSEEKHGKAWETKQGFRIEVGKDLAEWDDEIEYIVEIDLEVPKGERKHKMLVYSEGEGSTKIKVSPEHHQDKAGVRKKTLAILEYIRGKGGSMVYIPPLIIPDSTQNVQPVLEGMVLAFQSFQERHPLTKLKSVFWSHLGLYQKEQEQALQIVEEGIPAGQDAKSEAQKQEEPKPLTEEELQLKHDKMAITVSLLMNHLEGKPGRLSESWGSSGSIRMSQVDRDIKANQGMVGAEALRTYLEKEGWVSYKRVWKDRVREKEQCLGATAYIVGKRMEWYVFIKAKKVGGN